MPTIKKKNTRKVAEHIVVKDVGSWQEFLQIVSEGPYVQWAFRGQENADWQLWSTVSRELLNRHVHPDHWIYQEHRNIWIFQRKASHYLDPIPEVTDTPRWLALMQHHGAPTRLIDFTWSPYVAAFFALESSTTDAAVWAINAPLLGTLAYGPQCPRGNRPPSPQDFLRTVDVDKATGIAVGEPYFKNRRVISQSGTFVCPYDITRPLDETLAERPNLIAKFILRGASLRKQALRELYRMNITQATLFPDLDGLARSLKYELESHWEFDPSEAKRK
jgi:hypothetical protein